MEDRPAEFINIPTREEERPVRSHNGFLFANDAWLCRPVHLWPKAHVNLAPEWRPFVEQYLARFAEPVLTAAKEICCVACNEQVTGHHITVDDYRFRAKLSWNPEGTQEGRCTTCGYPMRMLHEIRAPSGQLLVKMEQFPLFYHPSATSKIN